jgi:tripartite-type tricarboxylate transporter receptor subunit TctC
VAQAVVRGPPDGYTRLLVTSPNATLYPKLNINFIRDIAPVASIGRLANVMEVDPSFPARTVHEFIMYAEANPGKIERGQCGENEHTRSRNRASTRRSPYPASGVMGQPVLQQPRVAPVGTPHHVEDIADWRHRPDDAVVSAIEALRRAQAVAPARD